MNNKKWATKLVIPIIYTAMALLVVLYSFYKQNTFKSKGNSPFLNLMEIPTFVKSGFDIDTITEIPDLSSTIWKQYDDNQPRRIVDSGLAGLPKRTFLSPFAAKDEAFTITSIFNITSENIGFLNKNPSYTPGVFLASIGENWEVYLNGKLIRSEIHLDERGNITSGRLWRNVYFPAQSAYFVEGQNVLTFRIIGDPSYKGTGMYYASPYYIDDYSVIDNSNNDMLNLTLCGIYFFAAIYHFLIFLNIRKENYNLYYSIMAFILGIFSVIREPKISSFFPNSDITLRIEYISLIFLLLAFIIFIYALKQSKPTLPAKIHTIFSVISGIFLSVVPSLQCSEEILEIWDIVSALYIIYFFVFEIVCDFFASTKKTWGQDWANFTFKQKNKKQLIAISETPLGNVVIGTAVILFCTLAELINMLVFHNGSHLLNYSFFILAIGTAFSLANNLSRLYETAEHAKIELEHSNENLELAVIKRTEELTEQAKALEHQTKLANQANEAKSKFLATMSHEIRTPMNAIIGISEIELMSGNLPPKTAESLSRIQTSGHGLLGIINDILDFSKIESGKLEMNPITYDLPSLIDDAVQLNIVRIGSRPIKFLLEIDPQLYAKMYGDELRLKQILNNILSNAFKYTDEGTVALGVSSKRDGDTVLLTFRVSDTGQGVAQENIKALFDEYSRFNEPANRTTEGTGLGMSITSRLVQMMNGKIDVESELGKGSTFTVTVEQRYSGDAVIGEELAEKLRKFEYTADRQRQKANVVYTDMSYRRVLIVDDVEINLLVAEGLMQPYKLSIETVTSGFDAIKKVESGSVYDIIFMDHMMPKMDGIETTLRLREIGYDKPIVALTANAIAGNDKLFKANGFDDFISKPIDMRQLNEVLKKFVRDKGKK